MGAGDVYPGSGCLFQEKFLMSIRNKGKGLFPTWTLRSLSTLWDTPGRGGRKGGVGNTVPRLQASTLWLHYVKSSFYILSPQRPACTTLRNLMRALCFLLFILNVLPLCSVSFSPVPCYSVRSLPIFMKVAVMHVTDSQAYLQGGSHRTFSFPSSQHFSPVLRWHGTDLTSGLCVEHTFR